MYEYFLNMSPHPDGVQSQAICPFHEETEPSFVVDPNTNQWMCFGCAGGGGPVLFLQKLLGTGQKVAGYIYDYYKEHDELPLPKTETVNEYHDVLLDEPELISYFQQLGVGINLLKEFKVGWDMRSKRIVFPIPSRHRSDIYINLRKYRPAGLEETPRGSKLINIKSLGENIFYPQKAFDGDEIFIVEGEKDMIVGRGLDLNTITGTGGGSIPQNDYEKFNDKTVYIMVDNDKAGDQLARKYFNRIEPHAKKVTRIALPEKDISDVVARDKDVNIMAYEKEFEEEIVDENVIQAKSMRELFKPGNENQQFLVEDLRVIGEDMVDYQVPFEVTLSTGEIVNVSPRDILSFLGSSDKVVNSIVIGGQEDVFIEQRKDVLAQAIYFKPDINMYSHGLDNEEYSSLSGIYINEEGKPLRTNRVYDMTLVRATHPKTQENMFVILKAEEKIMDADVDTEELEYFRRDGDIDELVEEYYEIWSPLLDVNGRKDLFSVTLLTYLSVLEFKWRNSTIKGRLDTIVIGDTRTGKTKMIKEFMNTLRMGEYVSGENAKATGIIGGINNIKNTWTLNWGKIPINDKRLVVIDEASGLSIDDITDLSQMRSEGILSITKIKQESTYARTRLLWITNPRNGERISSHYWNGYEALEEFLPVQEDLARFDLACSAAIEDVDNIFDYTEAEPMNEAEIDRWRNLVLFAWNIKADEIEITKPAEKLIMDQSIQLGNKFSNKAIFMSANGYEKLARVAIAAAVLTFNYNEEVLQVEERHVEYAVNLIIELYSKKSFGLLDLVESERDYEDLSADEMKQLRNMEAIYGNLNILFRDGPIPQNMVSTILGIDYEGANKVISQLYSMGLIEMADRANMIKPTPIYLKFIRGENTNDKN